MENAYVASAAAWIAKQSTTSICVNLTFLWLASIMWSVAYNVYFHPLRKYPGPTLSAAFSFPFLYQRFVSRDVQFVYRLHQRFGDIVRIGPDELSFAKPAWKDIFDRGHGKNPIIRHPRMYNDWEMEQSMLNANGQIHAQQRRVFSSAFSERAVREYEPALQEKTTDLIAKLEEAANGTDNHVDLVEFYTKTTTDIMAELTAKNPISHGEKSNEKLERGRKSSWKTAVMDNTYHAMICARMYPIFSWLFTRLIALPLIILTYQMPDFSADKIKNRQEEPSDIWKFAQRDDQGKIAMKNDQMSMHVELLMFAGSETTATLLSAVTYFLQRNPRVMDKLREEIDSARKEQPDMTLSSILRLEYLNACLKEALRLHPPAPANMLRMLPPDGAVVCGEALPGGIEVSIPSYTVYRLPKYWTDPESFVPERWLGDSKYASDTRDILQPFSVGPQNCLGMILAWHEARLILASVLGKFKFKLLKEGEDWTDQKASIIWDKKPLMVEVEKR